MGSSVLHRCLMSSAVLPSTTEETSFPVAMGHVGDAWWYLVGMELD